MNSEIEWVRNISSLSSFIKGTANYLIPIYKCKSFAWKPMISSQGLINIFIYVNAKLSSFHLNTCKIFNHQSKINVNMKNNFNLRFQER